MLSRGINIQRDLVQVQLHHHTSNGGIRIDSDAPSRVAGLFAAGEAAGWQGADWLGGTMLSGSQVFGWRAGAKAAKVAGECHRSEWRQERCPGRIDRSDCPVHRGKRERKAPGELRPALQKTMWETLLVEKDAESLSRARNFIAAERERLRTDLLVSAPTDLALAFEHRNLLDVGEAIVEAASMRTESRGSHFRGDYPQRDDQNWLTNIFVTRGNGHLDLRREWVAADCGWTDQPGDVRIKPWG